MIELAVGIFRSSSTFPAILRIKNVVVSFAFQQGLGDFAPLQPIQILEEQQPRGLLGIVKLAGATGILVQDVVDILKSLFKDEPSIP